MARGRRRIRREIRGGRPSTFFIAALILGLLVLLYVFMQVIRQPVGR